MNRFFSYAEDISEDEMQNIWAKILAGEIKQPKSFSKRTLDVVRNLTKEEAELITRYSSQVLSNDMLVSFDNKIDVIDLATLDDIGFIDNEQLSQTRELASHSSTGYIYGNTVIVVENEKDQTIKIRVPFYTLTKAGKEIMTLIAKEENPCFVKNMAEEFQKQGATKVSWHKLISRTPDGIIHYEPKEMAYDKK